MARLINQPAVPECDGPILLLLDVLTCCVGTLSLKGLRGQAGLLPHYSWVQLLCGHSIDPPALTEGPVEYSDRAMAAVMAEVSHRWCMTCRFLHKGKVHCCRCAAQSTALYDQIIYAHCVPLVLD